MRPHSVITVRARSSCNATRVRRWFTSVLVCRVFVAAFDSAASGLQGTNQQGAPMPRTRPVARSSSSPIQAANSATKEFASLRSSIATVSSSKTGESSPAPGFILLRWIRRTTMLETCSTARSGSFSGPAACLANAENTCRGGLIWTAVYAKTSRGE